MELHKFVPFIRSSDDFTTFLGVLCEAYTELLNCKPAQFEATVISEKYRFHLDTFVLYAWYVAWNHHLNQLAGVWILPHLLFRGS